MLAGAPGARAAWSLTRTNFGGSFLDFMDEVTRSAREAVATELSLDAWKIALASEAPRGGHAAPNS
jgi:hypothetical protein